MRTTTWMLAGLIAFSTAPALAPAYAADGTGLAPSAESWARWQGRLSFGTAAPSWRAGWAEFDTSARKPSRLSLMGDYYLSAPLTGAGSAGGLRATGGVILGPRYQPWLGLAGWGGSSFSIGSRPFGPAAMPFTVDAAGDTATLPYLGVGYTGLSTRSGWSFSADLGLVAQSPGNASRLGRALGGGQSLDDAVRDLRLAPLLQLGVSYSF